MEQEVKEEREEKLDCCNSNLVLKKATLQHVDIEINVDGMQKRNVKCLVDSGTEIPVVSKEVLKGMHLDEMGEVSIQCVVGKPVVAKLVKLELRLSNVDCDNNSVKLFNVGQYMSVICAVVDDMSGRETLMLHPELIAELKLLSKISSIDAEVQTNVLIQDKSSESIHDVNKEVSQETEEVEEVEIEHLDLENVCSHSEVKGEEGNVLQHEQPLQQSVDLVDLREREEGDIGNVLPREQPVQQYLGLLDLVEREVSKEGDGLLLEHDSMCGLVSDKEDDFERNDEMQMKNDMEEQLLQIDKGKHDVNVVQHKLLIGSVIECVDCCADKSIFCAVAKQEWELYGDVVTWECAEVPLIYRSEVERRSDDLINKGRVKPSTGPMESLLVFGQGEGSIASLDI